MMRTLAILMNTFPIPNSTPIPTPTSSYCIAVLVLIHYYYYFSLLLTSVPAMRGRNDDGHGNVQGDDS